MKIILLALGAIVLCSAQLYSQKASTIWGDVFTGNVVMTKEDSREITLEYRGKDKTETFVGVLKEGYQIKMKDGSLHDLRVSELLPGTRLRAYFKQISKQLDRLKVKINLASVLNSSARMNSPDCASF